MGRKRIIFFVLLLALLSPRVSLGESKLDSIQFGKVLVDQGEELTRIKIPWKVLGKITVGDNFFVEVDRISDYTDYTYSLDEFLQAEELNDGFKFTFISELRGEDLSGEILIEGKRVLKEVSKLPTNTEIELEQNYSSCNKLSLEDNPISGCICDEAIVIEIQEGEVPLDSGSKLEQKRAKDKEDKQEKETSSPKELTDQVKTLPKTGLGENSVYMGLVLVLLGIILKNESKRTVKNM